MVSEHTVAQYINRRNQSDIDPIPTDPDGAVTLYSANGLVGTEFVSWYYTLFSLTNLVFNRITTNY